MECPIFYQQPDAGGGPQTRAPAAWRLIEVEFTALKAQASLTGSVATSSGKSAAVQTIDV